MCLQSRAVSCAKTKLTQPPLRRPTTGLLSTQSGFYVLIAFVSACVIVISLRGRASPRRAGIASASDLKSLPLPACLRRRLPTGFGETQLPITRFFRHEGPEVEIAVASCQVGLPSAQIERIG